MGFWSWLFGKRKEEESSQSEIISFEPKEHVKKDAKREYMGVKPKYVKVPRTKEMKDYVNSIIKKAERKESEPMPHKENVDRSLIEKIVDKIQGRNK